MHRPSILPFTIATAQPVSTPYLLTKCTAHVTTGMEATINTLFILLETNFELFLYIYSSTQYFSGRDPYEINSDACVHSPHDLNQLYTPEVYWFTIQIFRNLIFNMVTL
jgi:hypothetical protein